MKNSALSFLSLLLLFTFSFGKEENRRKIEFFEKLYNTKIEGVKLFEEYPDPDQFYSAIARQIWIPEIVYDAVKKKYGWQQNGDFFLSLMIKGGGSSDDWGVIMTKFPTALKEIGPNATREEKMNLLKDMEMKMVVVGFDGEVSFPDFKDKRETRYANGKVKETGYTNDKGQRVGEWIKYHPNGQMKFKQLFKNGKPQGQKLSLMNRVR